MASHNLPHSLENQTKAGPTKQAYNLIICYNVSAVDAGLMG